MPGLQSELLLPSKDSGIPEHKDLFLFLNLSLPQWGCVREQTDTLSSL